MVQDSENAWKTALLQQSTSKLKQDVAAQSAFCMIVGAHALTASVGLAAQDGWKAWKKALKQSNQLDDDGYEDEAARSAAQMVADAHRKFSSKAGGKGKKGNSEEAEAEPFSLLHKVCEASYGQLFEKRKITPVIMACNKVPKYDSPSQAEDYSAFWASLRVPKGCAYLTCGTTR